MGWLPRWIPLHARLREHWLRRGLHQSAVLLLLLLLLLLRIWLLRIWLLLRILLLLARERLRSTPLHTISVGCAGLRDTCVKCELLILELFRLF